jgi:hypothetical protein
LFDYQLKVNKFAGLKIARKIIAFILVFAILGQGLQLAIVSYLYQNHNEVLVESCCINKNKDKSCKAKCVVDKTQKEQKNSDEQSLKKVDWFVNNSFAFTKIILTQHTDNQIVNDFYLNNYSFQFLEYLGRPPCQG